MKNWVSTFDFLSASPIWTTKENALPVFVWSPNTPLPDGSTVYPYPITYEFKPQAGWGTDLYGPVSNFNPPTYTTSMLPYTLKYPTIYGYSGGGWTLNNKAISNSIPLGTTGPITLVASFEPDKYTIQYTNKTVSDSTTGTVQGVTHTNPAVYYYISTPSQSVVGTMDAAIPLSPASAPGYEFDHWEFANGTIITEIPKGTAGHLYSHEPPSDRRVVAVFKDPNINIKVEYYFDSTLDNSKTLAQHPVPFSSVSTTDIPTTFAGYKLASPSFDPTLPRQMAAGELLKVYLVKDTTQTLNIKVEYYFDNEIDNDKTLAQHPVPIAGVSASDIPTTFSGYMLASPSFDPTLPRQMAAGELLKVYLVSIQPPGTIRVEYYFDGTLDSSKTAYVPSGTVTAADIDTIFVGYTLAPLTMTTRPFDPLLPIQMNEGEILKVYLVTDTTQAAVKVEYYFDGILDNSVAAYVPSGLITVADIDTTFVGYTLAPKTTITGPFDPILPVQMNGGDTLKVYLIKQTGSSGGSPVGSATIVSEVIDKTVPEEPPIKEPTDQQVKPKEDLIESKPTASSFFVILLFLLAMITGLTIYYIEYRK